MARFVDRVVLHARGGDGGRGVASVRREKFKPLGGPDGGNGGNGGDVVLEVDPQTTTLLDFHRSPHARATSGTAGMGSLKMGKNGEGLVLLVPEGTVVKNREGEVLADLMGAGTRYVAAAGGRGGLGNAALASRRRKAPGFSLLGEPGEEKELVLELKSIADVALVGFPSAGKSSLIAAMSAARPKVADYPFTTLVPNLGVVAAGEERFTVADVPGLIPGASEGRGLGLDFLRHIERCAVIVHVLDCATLEAGRDPITDLEVIEAELAAYEQDLPGVTGLAERHRVIVLNKVDVPEARELAELVRPQLQERAQAVVLVSAASHEGLRELSFVLSDLVIAARQAAPPSAGERIVIRPAPVDVEEFTLTQHSSGQGPYFQVRGTKPERWVAQTDFSNDEAVGFLADRLAGLGVEEKLVAAGAVAGDTVVIGPQDGGVIFDWEPVSQRGAELLAPRGEDQRLATELRRTTAERRDSYEKRRRDGAETREEPADEHHAERWAQADEAEEG